MTPVGPDDPVTTSLQPLPPDKAWEIGRELWSLGNVIAGFCIVQTIVFLEQAGEHCSSLGFAVAESGIFGIIGVALFLAAETGLIWLCHRGQSMLLSGYEIPTQMARVLRFAFRARLSIVVFALMASLAFIVATAWIVPRYTKETLAKCHLAYASASSTASRS